MSGTVNEYSMYPREESTSSVVVQRWGDHYNGIVITPAVNSVGAPTLNSTAPNPSSDVAQDDNLPFPWSLDPLPPVTPVTLPHFRTSPFAHNDKGSTTFSVDNSTSPPSITKATNNPSCNLHAKCLPPPWSLDPLPPVTPVMLQHTDPFAIANKCKRTKGKCS